MQDTPSFNLVREPWIPTLLRDGTRQEFGLSTLFLRAAEIDDITGITPPEKVALLKLLLAIIYRSVGRVEKKLWWSWWRNPAALQSQIVNYLQRWQERFDLFHPEKPFYQVPNKGLKLVNIIYLFHHSGSTNPNTLFDHHTGDEAIFVSPAQAARGLLTMQQFSFGGRSMGSPAYHKDAPSSRGAAFFLEGQSLLQLLLLNLTDPRLLAEERGLGPVGDQDDMPIWERAEPLADASMRPAGLVDYLTFPSRAIHLIPVRNEGQTAVSQMTFGGGLYAGEHINDPYKHLTSRGKDKGYKPQRFSEAKSLWRDSAAILGIRDDTLMPPSALRWMNHIADDGPDLFPGSIMRLRALGFADRPGDPKIFFYREERLSLPLAFLQDSDLELDLKELISQAEEVGKRLNQSLFRMAGLYIAPESNLEGGAKAHKDDATNLVNHWDVRRHYWLRLENVFRDTVIKLPGDPANTKVEWADALEEAARAAFDEAADLLGRSPAAIKASSLASMTLAWKLNDLFRKEKK